MTMNVGQIPNSFLVSAGQALLLMCTGYAVIKALRGEGKLDSAFFGMVIGMIGLQYFDRWIDELFRLSAILEVDIKRLGNSEAIRDLVWNSIKRAAAEPGANGERYAINIPSVIEQLFRVGVWGVVSSIGDLCYLLADVFIEVRRDVLLTVVKFLFPIICGLYPARPSLGNSIVTYLFEMALWGPCLYLIDISLGYVAPKYLNRPGSLGIPLVGMEFIAVYLILSIPRTVHQLMGGALHAEGEGAFLGMAFLGGKAVKAASAAKSVATSAATPGRRATA